MILCVLLICFRNSIFMYFFFFFFLMIRRPPRSTHCISSAASDVYKRQVQQQNEVYDFQAQPKVVKPRTKYKEPEEEEQGKALFANLMFDKRVVRGNTYACLLYTSPSPRDQA
eukprot:TRINITY_DN589_c0_g1_i13.p3 TRINITY_DN589_c0_g1~~TRINITY_DN589_c0_g1_i13.p3  ORF type:complete len:113 (-),score=41.71 TRINITY_DN589_c0_g1_i13:66-404(-)